MKKRFMITILAVVLAISMNVCTFAAEELDAGALSLKEEVLKEKYGGPDERWTGATYLGSDGIPVADLSKTFYDYSDPRIEGKWFYHMFVGSRNRELVSDNIYDFIEAIDENTISCNSVIQTSVSKPSIYTKVSDNVYQRIVTTEGNYSNYIDTITLDFTNADSGYMIYKESRTFTYVDEEHLTRNPSIYEDSEKSSYLAREGVMIK